MGGSQGALQMVAGGLDGARVSLLDRTTSTGAALCGAKLSLKLNGSPQTVTPEVLA
jgi:hypothetical protein